MSFASSDIESVFCNLSSVERSLLQLIATHGLITKSTWLSFMQFKDISPQLISSAMRSLTSRKIVVARLLHHGLFYFAFSKASIAKLGLPERMGNPLCEPSKLRAYARLLFVSKYRPTLKRLDNEALSECLDEKVHGLPSGFFGDSIDAKHFGFYRVDSYIQSSPERSAQVLRNDILRLISIKSVVDRFKREEFEIHWITATQRRADSVMQRFRVYDRVGGATINVVVLPELVPLVTSIEI